MTNFSNKKVVVAISGGVDSSVSAWLLKNNGYQVEGVFMKNWEENNIKQICNIKRDMYDAKRVCDKIGIDLYIADFSKEYWDNVFLNFLNEYSSGRTPNPDILCNKEIKFKVFLNFAKQKLDADFIATGHYVRRKDFNRKSYLLRGVDKNKDQTYFLYTLNQKQISSCIFPIGKMTKKEVRSIASKVGMITAYKKSSSGICFIGERNFRSFLSIFLKEKRGKILSADTGEEIGTHCGIIYYTIGQRKGLRIGGINSYKQSPWYVVDKKIKDNQLIVSQNYQHHLLISSNIIVYRINWINNKKLLNSFRCTAKIRYRQPETRCLVIPLSNKSIQVSFESPVSAATPGQSIVFYRDEYCLGGGIIKKILW